ncbi:MAG: TIGR02301 family protein [Phenylobacterium sp.]|uniref:TIGR02301 family protein n=1 Tax=Phenylobacterium sp. TaxID=1871053 RepID=UPI0027374AA8|nr:TIGR02301 family protein [Phenylobacterium sp.]MDP3173506.1 TIGR02301 family protein [Phenylobacterium sp.]
MRAAFLFFALSLALAVPAAAQPGAAKRPILLELAQVLGESHALRQACAGPEDQFWRARMMRLVELERADPGFEARLKAAFNQGFARHVGSACSEATRREEAAAAARGRALSSRLAGTMAPGREPR